MQAGLRVRLLFGDPDAPAVVLRGDDEGLGSLLGSQCSLFRAYLKPQIDVPGIAARQHGGTIYNSLFRFDDTVLVNTHADGALASHSPVLHIQKVPGGHLFTHYVSSFDRVWDRAELAPVG